MYTCGPLVVGTGYPISASGIGIGVCGSRSGATSSSIHSTGETSLALYLGAFLTEELESRQRCFCDRKMAVLSYSHSGWTCECPVSLPHRRRHFAFIQVGISLSETSLTVDKIRCFSKEVKLLFICLDFFCCCCCYFKVSFSLRKSEAEMIRTARHSGMCL